MIDHAQLSMVPAVELAPADSDEFYSPPPMVGRGRLLMDGIDLDPASCAEANQVIGAERYYTKKNDGMALPWHCESMWFNPPYSALDVWVARWVAAVLAGHVAASVALLPARTDTDWFAPLYQFPICFVHGRVRHWIAGGVQTSGGGKFPSVVVYAGPRVDRFVDLFSEFGPVLGQLRAQPIATQLALY